jgi:hypothetical protein
MPSYFISDRFSTEKQMSFFCGTSAGIPVTTVIKKDTQPRKITQNADSITESTALFRTQKPFPRHRLPVWCWLGQFKLGTTGGTRFAKRYVGGMFCCACVILQVFGVGSKYDSAIEAPCFEDVAFYRSKPTFTYIMNFKNKK